VSDTELVDTDVVDTDLGDTEVSDRIGQELVRLLRLVTRMRQQRDIAVVHVLIHLLEKGPQRVGEIAQALGTDPSTVSRQVTALVDSGLVERRADPDDGRAHLLAATESGVQQCTHNRRHRVEVIAKILSGWPEDNRRQLAALLGRFVDDMQEMDRQMFRRPGGES
jgi:DNA-binding MarR family transcriptional regulator